MEADDTVLKIQRPSQRDQLPLVTVDINGRPTAMIVDTGSPVSIVSLDTIPGLKLSKFDLKSYTGQQVPIRGEAAVKVSHDGQQRSLRIVVSEQRGQRPLLGRDWLREIRLDYNSIFNIDRA